MDRRNVAYDLSFYEQEQERYIARKEKKESVLIKAQTKFSLGKKMLDLVSIAALFALIIGVIATNAAITAYSTDITSENKNFQPMGANMGILPELAERPRDKRERYMAIANRALESMQGWLQAAE